MHVCKYVCMFNYLSILRISGRVPLNLMQLRQQFAMYARIEIDRDFQTDKRMSSAYALETQKALEGRAALSSCFLSPFLTCLPFSLPTARDCWASLLDHRRGRDCIRVHMAHVDLIEVNLHETNY